MNFRTRVSTWLYRLAADWQEFWFRPSAPQTTGLLRLLAGAMIFYTHLVWTFGLSEFFSSNGWQSTSLMTLFQKGLYTPSFWWLIPDGGLMTAHIICLVILFLFWIGCATSITSVLAFVITVSYAYRVQMANFGLDQVNGFLSFYLCLSPCGQAYSVDRWIAKWRATRAGQSLASPPLSARNTLAVRLIQIQLCVIYFFAGAAKMQGEAWWNGNAIWQAGANFEYQSGSLLWLAWYPWIGNLLTHVTILFEITFWASVWKRDLRWPVLAIGTMMHFGIGAFLGMWTFGLAMTIAYFAFLPPESSQWLVMTIVGLFRRGKAAETSTKVLLALPASADESQLVERIVRPTSKPAVSSVPPIVVATVAASDTIAESAGAGDVYDPLVHRPVILIVEPRVQSQIALQEYLFRHGFRCIVANDSSAARSVLASVDLDALFLDASWLKLRQINEFRSQLFATRGPASVTMVTPEQCVEQRFPQTVAHQILCAPPRLREVREMLIQVIAENQQLRSETQLTHAADELIGHRKPAEWSESLL